MGAIPVDSPPEVVIEAAPAAASPEFEIPVTPAETMEAQEPVFEIIQPNGRGREPQPQAAR